MGHGGGGVKKFLGVLRGVGGCVCVGGVGVGDDTSVGV